jgi:hypothetical protein
VAREVAKREQQEKDEREKKLAKERDEKAEKEARERLVLQQQQQQRVSAKNARSLTSSRNATASGSSPRPANNGTATKKILNKPTPVSIAAPTAQPRQQQQRPAIITSPQPPTPLTPQLPPHLPSPANQMYPPGPGMIPPQAMPPRGPYGQGPPPFGVFGPGPSMQQGPPPPLAPSAVPRNFGTGPPYDPGFRAIAGPPTTPIGPPPKASQSNTVASPSSMVPPGPGKRASIGDPGPVARPIAPIARPAGETPSSGSGSPNRRSPSPKGILGSSALSPDDDEVIAPPTRRANPATVGQGWGNPSPRSAIGENRTPWGAPSAPGFVSPRLPAGNSLWGNTSPGPEWQQPPNNFFTSPFVNGPSPPHSNT